MGRNIKFRPSSLSSRSALFRLAAIAGLMGSAGATSIEVALIVIAAISTSCADPGIFVQNIRGTSAPAALDVRSCEILAMNEFESPSDEIRAAYDAAVGQGRIVQLKNGTNVKQGDLLNFENKRLVRWTDPGPITAGEEARRHIGSYQWMLPEEGPYKGRRVCVSISMRYGKRPPL